MKLYGDLVSFGINPGVKLYPREPWMAHKLNIVLL